MPGNVLQNMKSIGISAELRYPPESELPLLKGSFGLSTFMCH